MPLVYKIQKICSPKLTGQEIKRHLEERNAAINLHNKSNVNKIPLEKYDENIDLPVAEQVVQAIPIGNASSQFTPAEAQFYHPVAAAANRGVSQSPDASNATDTSGEEVRSASNATDTSGEEVRSAVRDEVINNHPDNRGIARFSKFVKRHTNKVTPTSGGNSRRTKHTKRRRTKRRRTKRRRTKRRRTKRRKSTK